MNPNQQALDPKLKEAYDRVMGVGGQPAATEPAPVQSQPQAEGARGTAQPVQPAQPTAQSPISQTPVTPTPMQPTEAAQAEGAVGTAVPETKNYVAGSEEKKNVSPVIIGLVIFVFLIVYTLFWVKFFNIPIPLPFNL